MTIWPMTIGKTTTWQTLALCASIALLAGVLMGPVARAGGIFLWAEGAIDFTGRDILGTTIPLGEAPFQLKMKVPDDTLEPDPNTPSGIDGFLNPFSEFELTTAPLVSPRGGGTSENNASANRNGTGGADSLQFGFADCINDHCGIPEDSLGNNEPMNFQGLFLRLDLPDGTFPTDPFADFRALAELADAVDPALATNSISISLFYNPAPDAGSDPTSIRFIQGFGTISDITLIIPEPSAGVMAAFISLLPFASRRVLFLCALAP